MGLRPFEKKRVLKIKCKVNGSINKYKACLVIKGYTQKDGIDYEETFSLMVRFASIRLIMAIIEHLDLKLFQMDVKTTFLNGELDKEIYMDQPIHFEVEWQRRKVYQLKCSTYGLKQSSKQWYFRFHEAIIFIGFEILEEDHCVYLKQSRRDFFILSMYIDNILLVGNDMDMIITSKGWLSSTFDMKDMRKENFMLGVKILRDHSRKILGLS